MTDIAIPENAEPIVMHEGRYRLYKNPDDSLTLAYQPDGGTIQVMTIPAAIMQLAQAGADGKMSPMQMMKSAMGMFGGGLFG